MLEWKNAKKEKPEQGETVLVYASRPDYKRGGTVYKARYLDGVFIAENAEQYTRYNITHWAKI